MNARISSIYLVEDESSAYWKITLIDENGNIIGTFGDKSHSSNVDFRYQTYYMMKILNNWDLLKLDGENKKIPVLVDNEFYSVNYVANDDGDYLKFDHITGDVIKGSGCDVSGFCKMEISRLVSQSGVFFASITDDFSHRAVSADLVYIGFTPIYSDSVSEEKELYGARCFKEFICNILKLSGIKELIQGKNYPQVSVQFDESGKIIAIGNVMGDEYLYITDKGFSVIENKQRKK